MTKKEIEEFNEWFDNLSLNEQEQYIAELQAESYIDEYKNPELYY